MVGDRDFEKIRPADIDLTQPGPSAGGRSSGGAGGNGPDPGEPKRNRWLMPALGVAIVTALAVIFVLPFLVSGPSPEPRVPATVESQPRTVDESPFREAQLARARREAQDLLSGILDKQEYLEGRQVETWGADSFEDALAKAAEGDRRYRQRDFSAALEHYREADQLLSELENRVDRVVADALEAGRAALSAGDAGKAEAAFERALTIEPDSRDAERGRQRARVLPQVLALMERADKARDAGDWEDARELYSQVQDLDADHTAASEKLKSTEEAILERDFTAAMSRGFAALQAGNPERAEAAFGQALQLKSGHPDALSGRNQARNLGQQQWVSRQLNQATAKERDEQWQDAVDTYQGVLNRDESVMDARIGLIRARTRAELDRDLNRALADPLRLATPAVADHARELLRDARSIADPGPRLRRQIDQLAQSLEAAAQPVTVTLRSDNRTRVTLLRVGELGTFEHKQMELKPGRYVALGSREGYRDVRIEFQVDGSRAPEIVIECREPV